MSFGSIQPRNTASTITTTATIPAKIRNRFSMGHLRLQNGQPRWRISRDSLVSVLPRNSFHNGLGRVPDEGPCLLAQSPQPSNTIRFVSDRSTLLRCCFVLSLSIDFFPGSGRIESSQFREISGPAQFGLASFSVLRMGCNSFETRIIIGKPSVFTKGTSRMLDSIRAKCVLTKWQTSKSQLRLGQGRRSNRRLEPELLEDRQLLAASLLPIANVSVPALQGYTVPLLASSSDAFPQNYVVSSSNPDIAVTIPQGNFWTVGVAYTDPITPANSFTGSLTFQLFQSLTPTTVSEITSLTTDEYFVDYWQVSQPHRDRLPEFHGLRRSRRLADTDRTRDHPASDVCQ